MNGGGSRLALAPGQVVLARAEKVQAVVDQPKESHLVSAPLRRTVSASISRRLSVSISALFHNRLPEIAGGLEDRTATSPLRGCLSLARFRRTAHGSANR